MRSSKEILSPVVGKKSGRNDAKGNSRPFFEPLESRVMLSTTVESFDGTGNNLNPANNTWGAAGVDFVRLAAAQYGDGVSSLNLQSDQSPRVISNILNNQADPSNPSQDINTSDALDASDFGYAFGQFIDHDLDNTPDGGASDPIPVAAGDPIGPMPLPDTRSLTDPATGTSTSNPAQQYNAITSYLDLSQVYGSSLDVDNALRTFSGGQLKTSPGNMLPYDNLTYFTQDQINELNMANSSQAVPENQLYAAGDVRANENLELTTLETLFVRNHNLIATQLQQQHPTWTDQQLFDEARKINIAEYQDIVYNEWLPSLFGKTALPKYTGYNPNVNVTISNEFATVAFRFGHSLVSPTIARDTNDGTTDQPPVSLAYDFFDPYLITSTQQTDPLTNMESTDIGPILKGEADGNGQASDMMAINEIRNLLFGNGGMGGQDLMALDIQRGRDNGIPDYNTLRVAMGLSAVTSFSQISSNPTTVAELEQAYPGGVNTIDAFEGGLAEDHVAGSDVGPLFQAIIMKQFENLRDGDRFFYLNEQFSKSDMTIFNQGNTLTKIIENNTDITNLQSDVFVYDPVISGNVLGGGTSGRGRRGWVGRGWGGSYYSGLSGWTVELMDNDGNVLQTTTTSANGSYSFSDLALGTYEVREDTPSGWTEVSPTTMTFDLTKSETMTANFYNSSDSETHHHHHYAEGSPWLSFSYQQDQSNGFKLWSARNKQLLG